MRQGGIVVMNAEQLRDQDDRFDIQAAKELFGVTLAAGATATSETATQGAFYPVALAGATAAVQTDSGWPLMVQHTVGKGQAWLTASQWHWTLPQGQFKSLVTGALVAEGPRSVERPIKPFGGKAKVNLAKLGIAGRSDLKVYRIGPQFALEELPVEASKGQLSFGLDLSAEWQEYVLASPNAAARLFSEAPHR